ncbi:hypothetical protein ACFRR6_24500 [Streptomyces sp. NPDC056891]|uniref:hypothetical protein n=1 Tax=Streptomyces sp. NPDC056891 TaxID=3345961 RepID=UPI0036BAF69F
MDTGEVCRACEELIADRRALRRGVAARLSTHSTGLPAPAGPGDARKGMFEALLKQEFTAQEARRAALRERAAEERAARDAAVAARQAQVEAAAAARRAAPCQECGRQTAAEVCAICSGWKAVEIAAAETADLARARWTGPTAPAAGDRAAEQAAAEVRGEAEQAASRGRAQGATEETAVLMAKLTAELTAWERRQSALASLAQDARADAEAAAAFETEMRRSHLHPPANDARRAASAAAEAARLRVAEHLMATALMEGRERRREPQRMQQPDPYRLAAARVRAEIRRPKLRAA